ncbi:MAG: hypothetical protein HZB16_09765 [Armatimonadetes bacterium]|nr:hypothetical protein [Armatimonadota bacterium]
MITTLAGLLLLAVEPGLSVEPNLPVMRDKTLVVWVSVADLDSRGGSVLTLDCMDSFDGLVYGEIRPRVWMPGSDRYARTPRDQAAWPQETASGQTVRLAAVYAGRQVTVYRCDEVVAQGTVEQPAAFGPGTSVVFGLRHRAAGRPDCYFAGSIDEARVYARALTVDELRALTPGDVRASNPLGWWTFDEPVVRDRRGTFPDAELHDGAVVRDGKLVLDGKRAYAITPAGRRFTSPIHYRPRVGCFADPIPLFAQGAYHVFYLQGEVGWCPWQHVRSRDLLTWEELPTALRSDGAADGPDGGHMFTGSVMEHDGTFYAWYTGHNPSNPAGLEVVRLATSRDTLTWTKQPEVTVAPDGVIYAKEPRTRDWRDPYVFYNEVEKCFWMVVFANDAKTHAGVQGLMTSPDLKTWTAQPPLAGAGGQECPDVFRIGNTWYLIGGDHYLSADNPRGPWHAPAQNVIDRPGVYAGKRQFDGQRHIWTGWAWDGQPGADGVLSDSGEGSWGGYQCLPRELVAGDAGQLYCRPVREAVAAFSQTVSTLADANPELHANGAVWRMDAGKLTARASRPGSTCRFDVPASYYLEAEVAFEPASTLTVAFREQNDGRAYMLTIEPGADRLTLSAPGQTWTREHCALDLTRPVKVQAFVVGTMLECFVGERWAFSRRMYGLSSGKLGLDVRGAGATVTALRVAVKP